MHPEAQRIKDHWLKYRPRMSAELKRLGKLDSSVESARNLMGDSLADLVQSGVPYQSALEMVREIAYLPDEGDSPEL